MNLFKFKHRSAILLTSSVFFSREVDAGSPVPYGDYDGEYNNKEILPPPILKWQQQEQQFEYPSQYYPEMEGGNSRRIDDNSLIFRQVNQFIFLGRLSSLHFLCSFKARGFIKEFLWIWNFLPSPNT